MMQVNNKIVANWLKIATDLQFQLIASEEDKIKLSIEIERLREALRPLADCEVIECDTPLLDSYGSRYFIRVGEIRAARAALQPKEGE